MKQHLLAVKASKKAHVFKVFCNRKLRCNMLNQLTCHTPKRNAPGSNPGEDATKLPKILSIRAFGFFMPANRQPPDFSVKSCQPKESMVR